ncbi:MAG: MOSC domain-containing protein [Thermoplasmata archaeon]
MAAAGVVSVNVSRPGEVLWRGRKVRTSFFKQPSTGVVQLGPGGLAGDEVGDPRVHGGPRKAVYAYATEHYPFWRDELHLDVLGWGSFGENLSLRGVTEEMVRPGDRLEIGTAVLEVTQPRTPCFKMNVRFGREDLVRRFARAGRSGFYLGVIRPGPVRAGDEIRLRPGPTTGPTIREQFASLTKRPVDPAEELDDL